MSLVLRSLENPVRERMRVTEADKLANEVDIINYEIVSVRKGWQFKNAGRKGGTGHKRMEVITGHGWLCKK